MIGSEPTGLGLTIPYLIQKGSKDITLSSVQKEILQERSIIIVSNRGPVTLHTDGNGDLYTQYAEGGLVTVLTSLLNLAEASWIAYAQTEEDRMWRQGAIPIGDNDEFCPTLQNN